MIRREEYRMAIEIDTKLGKIDITSDV
ncbi:Asp23/Gls24 family envelope stress response protein, partial [Listeria monocytogenes]|nr:Asp23/Gls24 family envelope stress response protein [Listeria monocytogenes]